MNYFFLIFSFILWSSGDFVNSQSLPNTTEDYSVEYIANIRRTRGLLIDDAGDILVVSQYTSINAVYLENNTVNQAVIVNNAALRLSHGISYRNQYVYASSDVAVYRWPYVPGQRTGVTTGEQIVVKNMPPRGNHFTRTLAFDKDGLLYVSVGSADNVDRDSSRARVVRFNFTDTGIPAGGIDWGTGGVVVAEGVRNEVGIAFDEDGVLWGVQNGADELNREDLGGDIHNTNPAEELTKYDKSLGTHYGYPYCWTVYDVKNHSRGEQLAWPDFMNDGIHSDAWCQNISNNMPPTMLLPPHWAPLDITFYDGSACDTSPGAFPCSMRGDAFVAYHGSWNMEPPGGYRVVRIPINQQTGLPTGEHLTIAYETDPEGCGRCFRPVNARFDKRGHLIVSSDLPGDLFRITYKGSKTQ